MSTGIIRLRRTCGRLAILSVAAGFATLLMCVPFSAVAEKPLVADESSAANRSELGVSVPRIERQPLAAIDISDISDISGGDADVEAVAAIWHKLREGEGDSLDVDQLQDALRRMKAEDFDASEKGTPLAKNESPRRYVERDDEVPTSVDTSTFYSQEDARSAQYVRSSQTRFKDWQVNVLDRVSALRQAARKIDATAADLDDAGLFSQADRLFEQARSMRSLARSMLAPRDAAHSEGYDAAIAAATYNLHAMRSQLQLYRTEHAGRYPTVQPDADGKPSLPQLTSNTNEKGEIGTGAEFPLGPYMITVPNNPLSGVDDANAIIEIDHWPPKRAVRYVDGWLYSPITGQIAPNTPGHLND